MMLPGYTVRTRKTNGQFEAHVPEIGATVNAATEHDALIEAVRAIDRSMMEEYKKQKAEEERKQQ